MMQITADPIVRRLRWVMLGVMLFSMIATVSGQSQEFWTHPERAVRFDGLSIHDKTNPKFEFFIGRGWEAYLLTCLTYFGATFALVSVLPQRPALIGTLSLIFSHLYAGSNWLAVRWQYGVKGPMVYSFAVAIFVTLAAFPDPKRKGSALRRIQWVAVGSLLLDFASTLIGQPHSYWLHPETVHEANALSRMFLLHGWFAIVIYDMAYCGVILWLARVLPPAAALICMFAFIFGGYGGTTNWFFYEWRMGIQAPIVLGIVLSTVIVLLAFAGSKMACHDRGLAATT